MLEPASSSWSDYRWSLCRNDGQTIFVGLRITPARSWAAIATAFCTWPDPADAGSNLSETERVEAVLRVAKQQLAEVLDALARIDAGKYGTCADCGKPVPEGRLEAKPEAARCVACQGKRDRLRR